MYFEKQECKQNTIMRYVFLLIFLITAVYSSAQVYTVKDLYGGDSKIRVFADYEHNTLTISSFKDTIHIYEFRDFRYKPVILNGKFLNITYIKKTGSDQNGGNTVLICVAKCALSEAMHVSSFYTYDVTNVYNKRADSLKIFDEHVDYSLRTTLVGTNKGNYKLILDIHNKVRSKFDPKNNSNDRKRTSLIFDPVLNIFYNGYKQLSRYFTVLNFETGQEVKRHVVGKFPVIQFLNYEYYNLNGKWHEQGNGAYLIKYSYSD